MTLLGKTPEARIRKRYKLLKSYLRRREFKGVWLSRKEVEEIVDMLRPLYEDQDGQK
jgi:hypothetical protein